MLNEKEKGELKQLVLDRREEGKVVVMTFEGPASMLLEDIIKQPTDGLLYDLNRLEEVSLTFMDDPKWVNDFAVALVIRKLKSNLAQLEAEVERLRGLLKEVTWLEDDPDAPEGDLAKRIHQALEGGDDVAE